MATEPEVDLGSHPAVRGYTLVCLVALLALLRHDEALPRLWSC